MNSVSKDQANASVGYKILADGFGIDIFNSRELFVKYPKNIWPKIPAALKEKIIENFTASRTRPLTIAGLAGLAYQFAKPETQAMIEFGLKHDLSRLADHYGLAMPKLIRDYQTSQNKNKLKFILPKTRRIKINWPQIKNTQALIALSFGKDSLLSYALAEEIGLECQPVFVHELEQFNSKELDFKLKLLKQFERLKKVKVEIINDNADRMYYPPYTKARGEEFEITNAMLAFVLELMPAAYYYQSKYIVLGNEQNFNDSYSYQGYKSYPTFDQTSAYTSHLKQNIKKIFSSELEVSSLVEPLYNLAELKILFSRYPEMLEFVMSCSPSAKNEDRWCYECPMCAKAFLYAAAVGGQPAQIGINQNMLAKKYLNLFPLFARTNKRSYEKPARVRDEQLLAFLFAERNGWKGGLMDIFKQKYLAEAKQKEASLRKIFFGIHPAPNLPRALKPKVLNIFKGELKGLT